MRPFQSFEIEIEMSPWLSRVSSPLGGWSNPVSMHCSGLASCFPLMGGGGVCFVRSPSVASCSGAFCARCLFVSVFLGWGIGVVLRPAHHKHSPPRGLALPGHLWWVPHISSCKAIVHPWRGILLESPESVGSGGRGRHVWQCQCSHS